MFDYSKLSNLESFFLVPNYCQNNHCSHQCLLIPSGYKCSCPDGHGPSITFNGKCSAAFEHPLAQPYKCECKNGGSCLFSSNAKVTCKCQENFGGSLCEDSVAKTKLDPRIILRMTPSLILFIIVLILTGLVFSIIYLQKRNM